MDVPTYPKLVREFFENLRIGISSLECRVKNTLIVIDERRLGNILEMPRFGSCILIIKKKEDRLKVFLERDEMKT